MGSTGSMVARNGGGAGERKMVVAALGQKMQEQIGVDRIIVDVNIDQRWFDDFSSNSRINIHVILHLGQGYSTWIKNKNEEMWVMPHVENKRA